MPAEDFLTLEEVKTYFPVTAGVDSADGGPGARGRWGFAEPEEGRDPGLVGESGCGKTTLSRTIMQLQRATSGTIVLEGQDLTKLSDDAVRRQRVHFQMIFQDPYASLNPRLTIYDTLAEAVATRHKLGSKAMASAVAELMITVGLNPAQMKKYPHEFSGGQRQRIAIARALAPEPKLIIADEPVSALDVSIQSQILNLLSRLVVERGLTMIFISHDLSVVKYISDRIAVMYLGRIVELGEAVEVMDNPAHPYTKALISAIPVPDPHRERTRERIVLDGDPPSPMFKLGAAERPRPELEEVRPGHWVADPAVFLAERKPLEV
jgi:oligopeptide transport system ATP-binding protein